MFLHWHMNVIVQTPAVVEFWLQVRYGLVGKPVDWYPSEQVIVVIS